MQLKVGVAVVLLAFGINKGKDLPRMEKIVIEPDTSRTIEEQSPLVLLPMTVWGEARGEPLATKICVAHVIINRSNKTGLSLKDVVLKPKQFSVFNESDVNRAKLLKAATLEGKEVWGECVNAVWIALVNREFDPTKGATHYYSGKRRPRWARKMKETLTIRSVHFLRPG